jgi:hypothetical protein
VPYYDRTGAQIVYDDWVAKLDDPAYRIVAQTVVGDYWVSTIWLGQNHRHLGEQPPWIFESQVLRQPGGDVSQTDFTPMEYRRYLTEQDALDGHADLCTKAGLTPSSRGQAEALPAQ